ncbi:hypothetical protein ABT354_25490 [Streptomyces sp. NPDC000594]|uniref:hypothetical protein n=1 Tax=Streptomyces sp. NPDC000594 TaxID=3154261 RepID=UPI00332D1799
MADDEAGIDNGPSSTSSWPQLPGTVPMAAVSTVPHATIDRMETHQPPDGWTLQRIRDVSGDIRAEVLSPDRRVVHCDAADDVLHPTLVLGFGELCIVRVPDGDDWYWYMGSLNDDGGVVCWSVYDDLYEALRGL